MYILGWFVNRSECIIRQMPVKYGLKTGDLTTQTKLHFLSNSRFYAACVLVIGFLNLEIICYFTRIYLNKKHICPRLKNLLRKVVKKLSEDLQNMGDIGYLQPFWKPKNKLYCKLYRSVIQIFQIRYAHESLIKRQKLSVRE